MKKLLTFIAGLVVITMIHSCKEEVFEVPVLTVNPDEVEARDGESVEVAIDITAPGGLKEVTSSSPDNVVIGTYSVGATSATVTASITVSEALTSVTFTVTDQENQSTTTSVSVSVAETPKVNLDSSVDGVANQGPDGAWNASTNTLTLTAANEFVLQGAVYVNAGQTIVIEPGVVIRGGTGASALVVAIGGTILAEGTADNPIIFTALNDDLSDPDDLGPTDSGLWGGVVILGDAPNEESGSTTSVIEGITSAANDTRNQYGGDDATDNSGILKYVSIRHVGFELSPGNEINGLSLGGVGSGTTIDYVELYATSDDGIEFYGGTVSVQHLVMAFVQDDSFDWDQGYRGTENQYWFVIQHPNGAGFAGELDGGIPDGATLYSNPVLYNLTAIGAPDNGRSPAILMRDATAGIIANSIIADFSDKGIEIEDRETTVGIDSYQRLIDGELIVQNNIWSNIGEAASVADLVSPTDNGGSAQEDADGTLVGAELSALNNTILDVEFGGVTYINDGTLDPRPGADVTADLAAPTTGIETTTYKGAFDPANALWTDGWTAISTLGFTAN